MYIVDVSRDDLVKLFVERVKHWTDDNTVINLYKMMYEEHLIDNPAYYGNGIDEPIDYISIVDDDFKNCQVIYDTDDVYDILMEHIAESNFDLSDNKQLKGLSYIETYNYNRNEILVRIS